MVHSPGTQGLQADPLLRLEHSGVQNHRGTSRLSSAFDPRRRFPVPVSGAVDPLLLRVGQRLCIRLLWGAGAPLARSFCMADLTSRLET